LVSNWSNGWKIIIRHTNFVKILQHRHFKVHDLQINVLSPYKALSMVPLKCLQDNQSYGYINFIPICESNTYKLGSQIYEQIRAFGHSSCYHFLALGPIPWNLNFSFACDNQRWCTRTSSCAWLLTSPTQKGHKRLPIWRWAWG
jgi:hypothetical protein